jgi:hypothetical protein
VRDAVTEERRSGKALFSHQEERRRSWKTGDEQSRMLHVRFDELQLCVDLTRGDANRNAILQSNTATANSTLPARNTPH